MTFDASLVLHDGTTITADITPVSTTRASGSAVIKIATTSAKGMAAVMIVGADLAETSDTLLVTIEESDTEASGYVEVARFPLLTKGTGMPGTYVRRFDSNKDYIRAKIDVTDADAGSDFTVASVYIMLAYHPFTVL